MGGTCFTPLHPCDARHLQQPGRGCPFHMMAHMEGVNTGWVHGNASHWHVCPMRDQGDETGRGIRMQLHSTLLPCPSGPPSTRAAGQANLFGGAAGQSARVQLCLQPGGACSVLFCLALTHWDR